MTAPYWFDKRLGDAAVEFFPRYLRLTTGDWTRKPFHLTEWQAHHTRQIFGWRKTIGGARRYRRVRGFVPKKNGKTEWFAGIGHLLTIADGEQGAEVFSYARNEEQARIIFNRAVRMVQLDYDGAGTPGPLASLYDGSLSASLFCPNRFSAFKPLAGGSAGKHGPSVHGALGDEAHEWANGDIHQALVDGMIARRQPLDAIFTTAGILKTFAHSLYDDCKAIIADPSIDPECYAFCYEADDADDWTSPETWKKANPNYGVSVLADNLASACREALRRPSMENDFKRMHLGLWTEQLQRWLPMHLWKTNTRAPNDPDLWKKLENEMAGRSCRVGVDLASDHDPAAVSLCFEPRKAGERVTFLRRFYMPAKAIRERHTPRTPFKDWVRRGAIVETPGDVTDYDFIETQIKKDAEKFHFKRSDPKDNIEFDIAIDRHQATQVTTHLQGFGFKVARYGQEYANFNGPCRHLERLFVAGQTEQGNHPVAEWNYRNGCIRRDHHGYIKPDKENAANNIDGLVGDLMALGLTIRAPAPVELDGWLKKAIVIG